MASKYSKGDSDTRPWGTWTVLDSMPNYCVKQIHVRPNGVLSLQLHHHRCEHWIIVEGEAIVTLGDEQLHKKANDSIYIPAGVKHRIFNPSAAPLVFIEVQTGELLDENDIVRIEDNYGRK